MIRPLASAPLPTPTTSTRLPATSDQPGWEDVPSATYGAPFWLTYVANTLLMVAISLLFRYADFVEYLQGPGFEFDLGWIVGVGMIGSLLMRVAQGAGVDRYGPRQVWLASLALFVASVLGHLWVTTSRGPLIYVLQVLFRTAIAGAFGASITYVFLRMPPRRMAEAVGLLGTSGFVAMIVGPWLGDLLLGSRPIDRGRLDAMFLVAAALGLGSLAAAWLATRGEARPEARRRVPAVGILGRYWPGPLLVMGVVMGVGLGLPGNFVRPFAAELGISHIATFFSAYAVSAFVTRIATRRLPDRVGVAPSVLVGMTAMTAGMVLFLVVRQPWHFVIPAVSLGIAHALLFPAVVAGGSAAFPQRYRGLGTALMLGTLDLGVLLSSPIVGGVLRFAPAAGLPGYPTMFIGVGLLMVASIGYFLLAIRRGGRHAG